MASAPAQAQSNQDARGPTQPSATQTLQPIKVKGTSISPYGPVQDFAPSRTTVGTKTDTPIDEVPQSISVITRGRMDAQNMDSVSDVFQYTPGVKGEVNGNDARVDWLSFRGFNDNGHAVYKDSLQQPSFGFGQFKPELYGVQQVEVLRGPASMLYGQSNPGGLVNLVTKRPPEKSMGEMGLEFGNYDHSEAKFDVGGPITQDGRIRGRITGLGRLSDGQVNYTDNNRVFIAPALTFQLDEATSFTLLGHFQRDDTGDTNQFYPAQGAVLNNPNGNFNPEDYLGIPGYGDFDRTVYEIGYLFKHRIDDSLKISQHFRYTHLDTNYSTVYGGGLQPDLRTLKRYAFTTDSRIAGVSIDTNAEKTFDTGPAAHTLLLGVGYQNYGFDELQHFASAPSLDAFDRNNRGSVPSQPPKSMDINRRQQQIGIYAQDTINFNDKLILTLGGRQDWGNTDLENNLTNTSTDINNSQFTGRAGLVYKTNIGLNPFINYSTSFLPKVETNAQGEPFDPTTSRQIESGLRYAPNDRDIHLSLVAFNLVRQNVAVPDPSNQMHKVQTGEVRSRGLEFEGTASLAYGFDLYASYTFQDVEKTEDTRGYEGKRPVQVPKHAASVWLDYTFDTGALKNLNLGAGVSYKGSTYGDKANTFKVDDFALVDAAASYKWHDVTFGVHVKNLFDKTYVSSCTSRNACYFGSKRRITGSIKYAF
ncbi:TonB-dependent siderophore receptor [Salinisphaera sp. USBA-960]|nr:TonB-dependent siderophore receptor [Salifodinibacter halophilus]NNC25620.1 TonB-dependent siderophore receptor [Salifodinibacter halophilus]